MSGLQLTFTGTMDLNVDLDPEEFVGLTLLECCSAVEELLADAAPNTVFSPGDIVAAALCMQDMAANVDAKTS